MPSGRDVGAAAAQDHDGASREREAQGREQPARRRLAVEADGREHHPHRVRVEQERDGRGAAVVQRGEVEGGLGAVADRAGDGEGEPFTLARAGAGGRVSTSSPSSRTDWPAKRSASITKGSSPACTCLPRITTTANSTAMSATGRSRSARPAGRWPAARARSRAGPRATRRDGGGAVDLDVRRGVIGRQFGHPGLPRGVPRERTMPGEMADPPSIEVQRTDVEQFLSRFTVNVSDGHGTSTHAVTLSGADWERLGARFRSPTTSCVRRSPTCWRASPRSRSCPRSTSARSRRTSPTGSARSSRGRSYSGIGHVVLRRELLADPSAPTRRRAP